MIRTRSSRGVGAIRIGALVAVVLVGCPSPAVLGAARAAPVVTIPGRVLADLDHEPDQAAHAVRGAGEVIASSARVATGVVPEAPRVSPGIPQVALAAYQRAEAAMAISTPGCGLTWSMLAGIGKMESNHAEGGRVDAAGTAIVPIFGPWLDGSSGTAAIPASGAPTETAAWERAVGPMQFLPATWAVYGDGGDPQNIDDAALAAGRLLCAGGANLAAPGGLAAALYHYNPSSAYVEAVMVWARTYDAGPVVALSSTSGADPAPLAPDHSSADSARAAANAVAFATAQLGLPYVWGGNGPGNGDAGFDCSGLTHAAYFAAGVPTPRTAQTQYDAGPRLRPGAPLEVGDLVFYGTPDRVHHVGIFVGNDRMINAPTFGQPVQIARYRWSGDDFVGATRPAARPGSLPFVPPGRTTPRATGPRDAASGPSEALPSDALSMPADPVLPARPVPADGPTATPPPTPDAVSPSPSPSPTLPSIPSASEVPTPQQVTPPTSAVPPVPSVPPVLAPAVPSARSAPPRPSTTTPPPRVAASGPATAASAAPPGPTTAVRPGPVYPLITRARAVELFATGTYAGLPTFTFRDAGSGLIVVLRH